MMMMMNNSPVIVGIKTPSFNSCTCLSYKYVHIAYTCYVAFFFLTIMKKFLILFKKKYILDHTKGIL